MQISLSPEMEKIVSDKIASGLYRDEDEVIREALRMMDLHGYVIEASERLMRMEVSRGFEDLDAGRRALLNMDGIIGDVLSDDG